MARSRKAAEEWGVITTNIAEGIATVSLSRAASRNAFTTNDWTELQAAVEAVSGTSARVLMLTSSVEGSFCAGSDIKAMGDLVGRPEKASEFRRAMRSAIEAVASLDIPTIASIQGDCFGAGVALTLACDIRVARERARFGITPAKLGISYPIEDIARLVKAVGEGHARRLLTVADTVSASEALRIGLVHVWGEEDEARRMATAITHNASPSVVTMKRLIGAIAAQENLMFDEIFDGFFASPEFIEGMAAFREKRRPFFAEDRDAQAMSTAGQLA